MAEQLTTETLEWGEDYGPYKKGDAFDVTGPSREELKKTGKLVPSKKDVIKDVEKKQALPEGAVVGEGTPLIAIAEKGETAQAPSAKAASKFSDPATPVSAKVTPASEAKNDKK